MYKKCAMAATVVAFTGIGLLLLPSDAQETSCATEWSHPQTGVTQCLDSSFGRATPGTQPNLALAKTEDAQDLTIYLDHLANCQAYTATLSFPFSEDILVRGSIAGWSAENCVVQTSLISKHNSAEFFDYMTCGYSRNTLAMLTDKIAYQQAKDGLIEITTADVRSQAISSAMAEECVFSEALNL